MNRFVVEITLTTDDEGGTTTFYFGTIGNTTRSGDTPASTHISGRVKSAGRLRREMFAGNRAAGAVRPNYGEIVLLNHDGALDQWLDYGVAGGRVVVRMGDVDGAYPGDYTTVYIAYAHSLVMDFDSVRIRLRDRLQLFDKPLASGFAGTGGVEGSGGVSGVKQWVSENPPLFPPLLIDASKQIYFVQANSTEGLDSLVALYEGGVEITRGDDYASVSELLTTEPDVGECRFYFGEASGGIKAGPVYVRTHGVPDYPLRVDSYGGDGTGRGFLSFHYLAGLVGVDSADIESTGSVGIILGIVIDDERSILDLMNEAAKIPTQYFGFTRLDKFRTERLKDPSDDDSVYTFTRANSRSWRRSPPDGEDAPIYQVTMRTGRAYPSEYASSASATFKDYLSRDWWYTTTGESAGTLTANPGAISETVQTECRAILHQFGADNELARYFALFGGRRDFYTLTTPLNAETLALELHDVVTMQDTRFGMSSGRDFRIITQEIDCQDRTITFGLWGGTGGVYTGAGGDAPSTSGSSDPYVIQDEAAEFLRTESGLVLLIETSASLIQREDDAPIYTQTSAPVLTEA